MASIPIEVVLAGTQRRTYLLVERDASVQRLTELAARDLGLPEVSAEGTPRLYALTVRNADGSRTRPELNATLALSSASFLEIAPLDSVRGDDTTSLVKAYEQFPVYWERDANNRLFITVQDPGYDHLTSSGSGHYLNFEKIRVPLNALADELISLVVQASKLPELARDGVDLRYHFEVTEVSGQRRRMAAFEPFGEVIRRSAQELWLVSEPAQITELKDNWQQVFDEELWLNDVYQEIDPEAVGTPPLRAPSDLLAWLDSLIAGGVDDYFRPELRTGLRRYLRQAIGDQRELLGVATGILRTVKRFLGVLEGPLGPERQVRTRQPSSHFGSRKKPQPTVGIITALEVEHFPWDVLLDNSTECFEGAARCQIGRIPAADGGTHLVALWLGEGDNTRALDFVSQLLNDWPTIRVLITVGIANGVPWPENHDEDVHPGDVVVCDQNGVVQCALAAAPARGPLLTPPPRLPSPTLLQNARWLRSREMRRQFPWRSHLDRSCRSLGITRPARGDTRIILGPIASANSILDDAEWRNQFRDRFAVKACEDRASGIADPAYLDLCNYIVIRGISKCYGRRDGLDWRPYSAAAAAAYARALLEATKRFAEESRTPRSASVGVTVVVVDPIRHSGVTRVLDQTVGPAAIAEEHRQFQSLVDAGLSIVSGNRKDNVIRTGDGVILMFSNAVDAHRFGKHLHVSAFGAGNSPTEHTPQRWLRIGVATGELIREESDGRVEYAGATISNAVRLGANCGAGEILIDSSTWRKLPETVQTLYGEAELVAGSLEDDVFGHRYRVVSVASPFDPRGARRTAEDLLKRHREIVAVADKRLSAADLEKVIFLLEMPISVRPPSGGALSDRWAKVLDWADGPGGCGAEAVLEVLQTLGLATNLREASDVELLRLVASDRSRAAFGVLQERWYRIILERARLYVDGPEAENVANDTVLRLWESANRFDPSNGSVRDWLLAMTENTIVRFTRRVDDRGTGA